MWMEVLIINSFWISLLNSQNTITISYIRCQWSVKIRKFLSILLTLKYKLILILFTCRVFAWFYHWIVCATRQKQSSELFYEKRCSRPVTLLKKGFWHRCFPVKLGKFLRKPFLQNTFGRLLLKCRDFQRKKETWATFRLIPFYILWKHQKTWNESMNVFKVIKSIKITGNSILCSCLYF